jgi:hypothetical protein
MPPWCVMVTGRGVSVCVVLVTHTVIGIVGKWKDCVSMELFAGMVGVW